MFMAKTELQILFRELLSRVESFELKGKPAWVETSFVGGLKRLPVRVTMERSRAIDTQTVQAWPLQAFGAMWDLCSSPTVTRWPRP